MLQMFDSTEQHCPGSLECPVQLAAKSTALSPTAICRVCGVVLASGYAGRVPVHERRAPAEGARAADAAATGPAPPG